MMMKLCILAWLLMSGLATAGNEISLRCGVRTEARSMHPLNDIGGKHVPSRGMLRILLVFASFPDDSTHHPFWPARSSPLHMHQFIDPDTNVRSTISFNLTNYFRQMSLGQLNVIGEAIWVQSAHSQEEYRDGAYGRANRHILPESVDPVVDFSQYDSWTRLGDFTHANVPDGLVDMIVMVWRTNIFMFVGEASLGYRPGFLADGKRIEMGYPEYLPFPVGSGITCEYLYGDTPYKAMQTIVHELGHWLLGGMHPYNNETLHGKHSYWGILCSAQRAASCVNAYERERLGWITVPTIEPDRNIVLRDFLTTGDAYKYRPPNADPLEYFYVENHQKISIVDDATANPNDKGIWIVHQQGPYMEEDNFRIRPADGNWHWENPASTPQCFAQTLPVFRQASPNTQTGESHRDQIPNRTSAVNWLHAFRTPDGELRCGMFSFGEFFTGALNRTGNSVFSPYSNPNSNTWSNQRTSFSLEILEEANGNATVRCSTDPLDASPVRRYLGDDPTIPSREQGRVYLAWGAQWNNGQMLEEDVNWSELQRKVGNEDWASMYSGAAMNWTDASIRYDTNGTIPVRFRVRVRDTQGKYSTWSNMFHTRTIPTNGVQTLSIEKPNTYVLMNSEPNPFNPTTKLKFGLPVASNVSLIVYDVLGREVAQLVNAFCETGFHSATWNASDNASGVFIARFTASNKEGKVRYVKSAKLLLMK